jgi:hypothetical protein
VLQPGQRAKLVGGSQFKEHAMSHKLNSAVAVVDIDIGKNSFHVVGQDLRGEIVLRQSGDHWSVSPVSKTTARAGGAHPIFSAPAAGALDVRYTLDSSARADMAGCRRWATNGPEQSQQIPAGRAVAAP